MSFGKEDLETMIKEVGECKNFGGDTLVPEKGFRGLYILYVVQAIILLTLRPKKSRG